MVQKTWLHTYNNHKSIVQIGEKKNSKKILWLEFVWINSLNNNNNNKDFFRNWKLSIWTTTTTTTIIIIIREIIFLLFMSDQGNDHDHVCYTRVESEGKTKFLSITNDNHIENIMMMIYKKRNHIRIMGK